MKNFFDIATPEEIRLHFSITTPEFLAHLRDSLEQEKDRNYGYLASLYFGRGDETTTQYYLDQIKDEGARLDVSISLYELHEA